MFAFENYLLIDIETVPCYKNYSELPKSLQALWNKKSAQIYKGEDVVESFETKGGIYAEFGKIICIGLGVFLRNNKELQLHVKSISGDDELKLLREFSEVCKKFFTSPKQQFCGHNIKEFDISYLCRRYLINHISMPSVFTTLQNKKPWETGLLDTLHLWRFGDYKHYISMDLLSTILGIETSKIDMDGSMVAGVYWHQNNLKRINEYCLKDIVCVAQVLLRLHDKKILSSNQILYTQ